MAIINDLWTSIPPITRTILLISILLTGAVSLDLCTPFKLYFNYNLIKRKFQFWRIFTSLFYFGEFSVDTIFDFFILYRYSSMLESHSFRNKPAEFILFFVFGSCIFIISAIFLGLEFLSPCLSAMMLYLWSRRNPNVQINFLEIFHFRAPFLPWFLLLFVLMFGFNPKYDLIGVGAGHFYYYLEDIVPKIPETRDVKVLKPPKVLVSLCEHLQIHDYQLNEEDFVFEEEQAQDTYFISSLYHDHDTNCKILRKPDSFVRTLMHLFRKQNEEYQSTQLKTPYSTLLYYNLLIETIFYLPNRFRQIVLLNTQTVAFTQTESALLSLMSIMFNIQKQTDLEIKLRQFISGYRHFFFSTMLYEGLGFSMRIKMFEHLSSQGLVQVNGQQSLLLNGFLSGLISQAVTLPLFKLNIASHNYKISDSPSFKDFRNLAFKQSNQGLLSFLFQAPTSLLFRGGILGMIQQGAFRKVINFLENTTNVNLKQDVSQNERMKDFIQQVENQNEILIRLSKTGYFNTKFDLQHVEGVSSYRNILLASFASSVLLGVVMTPLDLVVFNQVQTRLYGPKSLRKITFRQVARDVFKTKGIGIIMTMTFASSLVRYFFVVTSIYCVDNHLKSLKVVE